MTKITVNEIPKKSNLDIESITSCLENASRIFNLTGELEIEILFVSQEDIQALNRKHRNIDSSTDVLSFPQAQFSASNTNILGSIVINPENVIEKGEGFEDVLKHGFLHLIGYDHETNENEWDEAARKIDCNL